MDGSATGGLFGMLEAWKVHGAPAKQFVFADDTYPSTAAGLLPTSIPE